MSNDDRIAALEAQVARLAAMVQHETRTPRAGEGDALDRRSLLRRGGLALAGIAGAAAVPTVLAGSAAAADGDNLIVGQDPGEDSGATNNVASSTTGLEGSVAGGPVLRLENTAGLAGLEGDLAHPVLRLTPSAGFPDETIGDAGDLMVSDLTVDPSAGYGAAFLNFAHTGPSTGDDPVFWGNVYTSQFASFIELLPTPVRVLDTRKSPGKRNAQTSLTINVGHLVSFGLGVIGNLTVTEPEAAGRLTLYPGPGNPPLVSSLNFSRSQTIANFAIVGLNNDTFRVFTTARAHIIFDVAGFIVADAGQVAGPASAAAATASRAGASGLRGPTVRMRRS